MSEINSLCRLCSANVKEDGLCIFGDRGEKSFLQSKIKLYLHFSVSENDDLPNYLCASCFRKLESIHRFASMALCMQQHLRSHLGLQTLQNADVPSPHSLLQSVQPLPSEQSAEVEQEEEKEEAETDCEVMEMEINPMSILYPGDENSDPIDEKSDESEEESEEPKMSRKKNKPYICMYCSRGFVQELSLWNHLWLHKDRYRHQPKLPHNKQLSRLNDSNSPLSNRKGKKKKLGEKSLIIETEEISNVEPKTKEENMETENSSTEVTLESNAKTENGKQHKFETEEEISETEPQKRGGVENNLCGVCRENCESQSKLEIHLVKHHEEGKFGCRICSRVFRSKERLEQHETNHNVRDYTCKQCGRVYSTKSSLSAHLVTHSDVRRHKCALCPKTFKRNQDLKFHMNQHTGERPYVCPFCPKAFASSGNCFSHRKRIHPQEMKQAQAAPAYVDVQ